MKLLAATACCLLGAVTAAHASVWEDASAGKEPAVDDASEYDDAMDEGDQATRLAASQSTSSDDARKLVNRAVRAYERAAKARPDRGEPHWRAAMVLYTMELDCPVPGEETILCNSFDDAHPDPDTANKVIHHWDEAERLDPLDPRLITMLFDRAILHTKLATDEDLAFARDDYEKLLDRGSTLDLAQWRPVFGNLAETYMMLGDLDHAITAYLDTIRIDASTSQMYGLSVAYDRDEQGAKAKEIIVALGEDAFTTWSDDVERGLVFYVPDGEVFYYKGLLNEALGHDKEAVVAWKRFIQSGAHPGFQPRAQDHLDKLKAKLLAQAGAKTSVPAAVPAPPPVQIREW